MTGVRTPDRGLAGPTGSQELEAPEAPEGPEAPELRALGVNTCAMSKGEQGEGQMSIALAQA